MASKAGYVQCPGCLSHVRAAEGRECPFCGDALSDVPERGGSVFRRLGNSRAALVALGLAGSVAFTACGEGEPKNPDPGPTEPDPGNDYGGFDPDFGPREQANADMGADMAEEEPDPANDYGSFDPDAG